MEMRVSILEVLVPIFDIGYLVTLCLALPPGRGANAPESYNPRPKSKTLDEGR